MKLPARARRALPAVVLLASGLWAPARPASGEAGRAAPAGPPTPAERCEYRCTPSYGETIAWIGELTKLSPDLRLGFFGESAEGYPLPVVIAARGRLADPQKAREAGLPVVLIFSAIHAGEIDGKDASLLLLREIATGERAALLEKMVLLVVPIYNADGHERVSPANRLAQDGPVDGMGFRTNGRGLDLNRDFMKMESPETESLVGSLFRTWRPHLVVDCHVTDGMDFQYVMTHFGGVSLNSPPPLSRYVERMRQVIDAGVTAAGYASGSFLDFIDPADLSKGVKLWASTPRFSTAYFEAHHRVSLLAEAHSHKPFPDRVAATAAMLRSIVAEVARDPEALVEAVEGAERESLRRVREGASFALVTEVTDQAEMVPFAGWEQTTVRSGVTGKERVLWDRDRPVTRMVPWYGRQRPTVEVTLPRGYLMSRAYGHLARKAWLHGLRVERTLQAAEIEVETYRVTRMTWADRSFQGHHPATAEVVSRKERRRIPEGTWWIPLDQPSAPVAVYLLEPQSPDGLLAWNFFDNVLERKTYASEDELERLAEEMLRDPDLRGEWERALTADPSLKESAERSLAWFYERSPYVDEQAGLYPVFRTTSDLPIPTAPWEPVAEGIQGSSTGSRPPR